MKSFHVTLRSKHMISFHVYFSVCQNVDFHVKEVVFIDAWWTIEVGHVIFKVTKSVNPITYMSQSNMYMIKYITCVIINPSIYNKIPSAIRLFWYILYVNWMTIVEIQEKQVLMDKLDIDRYMSYQKSRSNLVL